MLPPSIQARVLQERQVLGLLMREGSEQRAYYFGINTVEQPIVLEDFALGSATAFSTTGTDWQEIQDASNNRLLQPQYEGVAYQFYFGISPGQARIFRRYPSNTDINSLVNTRPIGPSGGSGGFTVGAIDGWRSPYRNPDWQSEMFSLYGNWPAFLGYHPFPDPGSINIRMTFYVVRYNVAYYGSASYSAAPPRGTRANSVSDAVKNQAVIRAVGGSQLIDAPQWLREKG